jgi:transposase-like protein
MLIMSKHYPVEQRERAVKMVLDHLDEYRSVYAACQAVGPKVGVGAESLRRWVLQAQVDGAPRPKPSPNTYTRFTKPVLRPPIESAQYTSIAFAETLVLKGSRHLSAAAATPTTTHWLRPRSGCTRPKPSAVTARS